MDNTAYLRNLVPLFHQSPQAMMETDGQGRLRQANPKAIQLLMPIAAQAGLPGDNVFDMMAVCLPSVRQTLADFCADSGLVLEQELCWVRPDEATYPAQLLSLTIAKQTPDSLLIFVADVTDLHTKLTTLNQRP